MGRRLVRVLMLVILHDLPQFLFVETQRLFTENMLAGFERCQYLSGMQVMTRGYDDGVDGGIAEQDIFVGGVVVKSNLLSGVAGVGSVRGADFHQRDST